MLPPGTWPYLLLHLAVCAVAVACLGRWLARDVRPGRAVLAVLGVGAFGCAVAFLTAPRLPGGYGFAVMLAWSWTGALIIPPVLASTGLLLLRARWRSGWIFNLLAGAVVVSAVDAFAIEPTALEISHHEVPSDRIERPLRVALIADLQTDDPGEHERAALRAAAEAQPDVVVFPGDVIQVFDPQEHAAAWQKLRTIIDEVGLEAPLGMYVTTGDVDWPQTWPHVLSGTDLIPLSGVAELREDVILTGLDLHRSARTGTVRRPHPTAFHIVTGHRPDFALGHVDADLLLAGHTHGGQVQLPVLGPIIKMSDVPRSWAAGRTDLGPDKTLFVSRGVGMERGVAPRLRFLCPPELVIIDIVPW